MRIQEYLLSFFFNAEKKTKEIYLSDLLELQTKIISTNKCSDVYETTRILLYAVDEKLDLFEHIKKMFIEVNYGQHNFVIEGIDSIIKTLRYLNKISYVANICKIHQNEPLLSYVYINLGGRAMNDLASLKRADEVSGTKDLEPVNNGAKLKKVNIDAIQAIEPNLKILITYVSS